MKLKHLEQLAYLMLIIFVILLVISFFVIQTPLDEYRSPLVIAYLILMHFYLRKKVRNLEKENKTLKPKL